MFAQARPPNALHSSSTIRNTCDVDSDLNNMGGVSTCVHACVCVCACMCACTGVGVHVCVWVWYLGQATTPPQAVPTTQPPAVHPPPSPSYTHNPLPQAKQEFCSAQLDGSLARDTALQSDNLRIITNTGNIFAIHGGPLSEATAFETTAFESSSLQYRLGYRRSFTLGSIHGGKHVSMH